MPRKMHKSFKKGFLTCSYDTFSYFRDSDLDITKVKKEADIKNTYENLYVPHKF